MRSSVVMSLLLAGGLAHGAQSASEAAVEWLRHVASGEAESKLTDETAVSPDTSEAELKSIRSRITQLRGSLRADDLKAVANQEDGDLAAVLVSQITNFDANSVQIHAVGLVKSDDKWLPAPLPSSFNNTGLSLRPGFLQRVKKLEDWMLKTRSTQLVRLKDDAFSLLFDEMKKAMGPEDLVGVDPHDLAKDFLKALRGGELPSVLAMMGGMQSPRPADFDDTFQVISRVLRKSAILNPGWRLLAAPEAARAIVMFDDNGAESIVSVVALDPAGDFDAAPRPKAAHFSVVHSPSGGWRVRLPEELLSPVFHGKAPRPEADDDAVDADLISMFPAKLREAQPAKPEPTARGAAEAIVAALQAPSFEAVCERMEFSKKEESALDSLKLAATFWQRIHRPQDYGTPILLTVHEQGEDACALVQMFSGRDPAKASIDVIFLHRSEGGWLANPGFSGGQGSTHSGAGHHLGLWLETEMKERENDWSAGVLVRIGGIAADSAPSEDEAKKVVSDWRKAIAAGDGAGMLAMSACFDDNTGTTRLLRNVGYELTTRQAGEILAVHRSGRWAAVSLRVPPADGDDSADAYPLVVVAATPSGPRVLGELDLFDPLTRSREFLNRSVWNRVSARLPDGARGELESIYEKHRTISAAERERRPKPTE